VEDESVIRYIADALKLRDDLKYPLYSATPFMELRSRFETIEKMTKSNIQSKQAVNHIDLCKVGKPVKRFDQKQNQSQRHCFNCCSTKHMRAECKEETKCFKYNGGGHTSRNCPGEKPSIGLISESRAKVL